MKTKKLDPLNVEFLRLLESSGWSQSEAARQLDLAPATISQYKSGETRPSRTTLRLMKLILGDLTPLNVGGAKPKSDESVLPLNLLETELVGDFRLLSVENRQWLASVVKELSRRLPGEKKSA